MGELAGFCIGLWLGVGPDLNANYGWVLVKVKHRGKDQGKYLKRTKKTVTDGGNAWRSTPETQENV